MSDTCRIPLHKTDNEFPARRRGIRVVRSFALLASGGSMFLLAGCLSGVAPVWASFGQSALVSWLFSAWAG